MRGRAGEAALATEKAHAASRPDCCLDGLWSRRRRKSETAKGRPSDSVFDSVGFESSLKCIDCEDSVCTVIENERQHGRMRVKHHRKLPNELLRCYLEEWSIEHKARGFGQMQTETPAERLREVVVEASRLRRMDAANTTRRGDYGSVRNLYSDI